MIIVFSVIIILMSIGVIIWTFLVAYCRKNNCYSNPYFATSKVVLEIIIILLFCGLMTLLIAVAAPKNKASQNLNKFISQYITYNKNLDTLTDIELTNKDQLILTFNESYKVKIDDIKKIKNLKFKYNIIYITLINGSTSKYYYTNKVKNYWSLNLQSLFENKQYDEIFDK